MKQKKKQQQSRINTLLKSLYTDVSAGSPALFTSVEPLYREAKKIIKDIKREEVEEFLIQQPTYIDIVELLDTSNV